MAAPKSLPSGSSALAREPRGLRLSNFSNSDLQKVVSRLSARSKLPFDAQKAILGLPATVLAIPARRDVARLLGPAEQSCFVSSGLIARYRQLPDGERQITAFHIPGDVSDFHSAVRPTAFGGLYAVAESTVICISYPDIRALISRFPSIGEALWQECTRDMAVMSEWVVNLGRRNAVSRTAHLFCEMAARFGGDRKPTLEYDFPITQEDLASALGMTGVHLNRVLKQLRSSGLLVMQAKHVRILSWRALVALGQFDASYLQAEHSDR